MYLCCNINIKHSRCFSNSLKNMLIEIELL